MLSFYQALPTIDQFSSFYIPGYTESLKTFKGVRVIPDLSFTYGFPSQFHSFLNATSLPAYFIPLYIGRNVYGFVIKGSIKKRTPQFSTVSILPGQADVKPNSTVVLCEGFKDVYLLRLMGVTALPILTADPPAAVLKYLAKLNCRVIFVPDNDEFRNEHINTFLKTVSKLGCLLQYQIFYIQNTKDLGGIFDSEEDRRWAIFNARVLYNQIKGLELSTKLQ